MLNLNNRLKKVETDCGMGRGSKRVFFFRDDPNVPGEAEKRFRKNTPDIDNYTIYLYSFGKANLG